MQITIGIDGNEANGSEKGVGQRVGVNQYTFEILWALFRQESKKKNKNFFKIYLKSSPSNDLPTENSFWRYKIIPGGGFWVIRKLMFALFTDKVDIFFSPNHYLPPFITIPSVCTIHDLGYLKFSGQFRKFDYWQLRLWSAISIIISKYIICPSKSARDDIVRHYPFASKKVHVVYHGYSRNRFNTNIRPNVVRQVKEKYHIDGNYLLFLGTLKPSKNIEGLLAAYSLISKEFTTYKLVISGKKGWMYDKIFTKVEKLGISKDVIFTDYVLETDKPALIAGAKVFVLPSFWEGFGMDVVNAMGCGVPVVVSKAGSLPEVAGDAGIYVNPYNTSSIQKGIKEVLTLDPNSYDKLRQKCLNQARFFSWDKAGEETLRVLEKAVS